MSSVLAKFWRFLVSDGAVNKLICHKAFEAVLATSSISVS